MSGVYQSANITWTSCLALRLLLLDALEGNGVENHTSDPPPVDSFMRQMLDAQSTTVQPHLSLDASTIQYLYWTYIDTCHYVKKVTLSLRIFCAITFSICFLVATVGNSLIMAVLLKNPRMRTNTNFLLSNMVCSDILVSLFCILPRGYNITFGMWPFAAWKIGSIFCGLYGFLMYMSLSSSLLFMLLLAGERFIAINYVLIRKDILRKRRLIYASLLAWLFSIVSAIYHFFNYELVKTGQEKYACEPNFYDGKSFIIFTYIILISCYILPLLILIFLYASIIRSLINSHQLLAADSVHCGGNPSITVNSGSSIKYINVSSPKCTKATIKTISVSFPNERNNRSSSVYLNKENNGKDTGKSSTATSSKQPTRSDVYTGRLKVIKLLVAVVTCFALCNLPRQVINIWLTFTVSNPDKQPNNWLFVSAQLVFFLNSAVNPLIYVTFSQEFQRSIRKFVCVELRCWKSDVRRSSIITKWLRHKDTDMDSPLKHSRVEYHQRKQTPKQETTTQNPEKSKLLTKTTNEELSCMSLNPTSMTAVTIHISPELPEDT